MKRRRFVLSVLAAGVLVLGAIAFGLWRIFASDGQEESPWLYCTTNPCQPLGLFAVPTPPALTTDASLAASCDYSAAGASDGLLLWHTDWDPRTEQGRCASSEEADTLGAK